jgi:hypothetical protein
VVRMSHSHSLIKMLFSDKLLISVVASTIAWLFPTRKYFHNLIIS